MKNPSEGLFHLGLTARKDAPQRKLGGAHH
jgi:hypothetical protein